MKMYKKSLNYLLFSKVAQIFLYIFVIKVGEIKKENVNVYRIHISNGGFYGHFMT